jgi:hypothetical protein
MSPFVLAEARTQRFCKERGSRFRGSERSMVQPTIIMHERCRHDTPSFFCRLDDEVVYWKVSFLSG